MFHRRTTIFIYPEFCVIIHAVRDAQNRESEYIVGREAVWYFKLKFLATVNLDIREGVVVRVENNSPFTEKFSSQLIEILQSLVQLNSLNRTHDAVFLQTVRAQTGYAKCIEVLFITSARHPWENCWGSKLAVVHKYRIVTASDNYSKAPRDMVI